MYDGNYNPNYPPNQNYPPQYPQHPPSTPSSQSYCPPPVYQTQIHGVIVGLTKDGRNNYLFYTSILERFVEISNTVKDLYIGRWLGITIWQANYLGEYILDNTNSTGYQNHDILPNPNYAAAKFFPRRDYLNTGELMMTARFGVRINHQTRMFDVISYDFNFNHLVDDFHLIKNSDQYYDGRSFIVEAQASLRGWVVLKVHEDPQRQYSCDSVRSQGKALLPEPLIDFNVQFLEDCQPALLPIMTGDGHVHPPPNVIIHEALYDAPSTSRQNVPQSNPHSHTASSSANQPGSTSEASENHIDLRQIDSSMSRATIRETPAAQQSTSQNRQERPGEPQRQHQSARESSSQQEFEDVDIDEEDTEGTLGTSNIPDKQFIVEVAEKTFRRCKMEKTRGEGKTESALCTVVQKFDGCAILYTAKRDVLNILVLESICEGLEGSLKLGQIAFFEILPRRSETQDELLPRAFYTHIAVRMKPVTPESQKKIDRFQKSVRCFGGLVEMKVYIPLTQKNVVEQYYETDEMGKMDSDKTYYYLQATNGVRVTIPTERLIHLLNSNFTANFNLIAWAVHRKAIGNVPLHIGKSGEAYQKFVNDGALRELPPLSNHYMMNVRKK